MLCLNIAGSVSNSLDPDETPRSAASHLGLHCLLRHICPNTYDKYGINQFISNELFHLSSLYLSISNLRGVCLISIIIMIYRNSCI